MTDQSPMLIHLFTQVLARIVALMTSRTWITSKSLWASVLAGCVLLLPINPAYGSDENLDTATFAGGCFWCMEHPFDEIDGVVDTTVGYAGGTVESPSYRQVSSGNTGHAEVVQVTYDPKQVSYEDLLEVYWVNVDPLDDGGQFCDRGNQYRTAIFVHDDEQLNAAETSKTEISEQFSEPVATQIATVTEFYPAEDYHQDYSDRNPIRYNYYRLACGRDRRLTEVWGQPAE
ncbi:MAG: peptide-methionine (S)-S-oxide reductase MsrA [Cyanobacteria bacterium P01_E01_bin.34]